MIPTGKDNTFFSKKTKIHLSKNELIIGIDKKKE